MLRGNEAAFRQALNNYRKNAEKRGVLLAMGETELPGELRTRLNDSFF